MLQKLASKSKTMKYVLAAAQVHTTKYCFFKRSLKLCYFESFSLNILRGKQKKTSVLYCTYMLAIDIC